MTIEDLKAHEAKVFEKLDSFVAKYTEEVKNVGTASAETKTAIEALQAQVAESQEQFAKGIKRIEELELIGKRFGNDGASAEKFDKILSKALLDNKVSEGLQRHKAAQFEVKATMTTASNLLNDTIRSNRLAGIVGPQPALNRVRDVLTTLPLSATDAVSWIKETGFSNAATVVPDDGTTPKPESDLTLDTTSIPVATIAHTFRVHKNSLADLPLLATYIATRGVEGLLDVEDTQILYGPGGANNLTGILTDALSAFDPTRLYAAMVAQGNRGAGYYDILRYAMLQIRLARMRPNAHLLNPVDKANIDTLQIQDGSYRRGPDGTVLVNNIWGVPVVEVDAMTEGEFATGAFAQSAILFEREGVSVEFFDQDRDNVIKNLVTVRIEERIAVATQRPEGIVTGDFADYLNRYAS